MSEQNIEDAVTYFFSKTEEEHRLEGVTMKDIALKFDVKPKAFYSKIKRVKAQQRRDRYAKILHSPTNSPTNTEDVATNSLEYIKQNLVDTPSTAVLLAGEQEIAAIIAKSKDYIDVKVQSLDRKIRLGERIDDLLDATDNFQALMESIQEKMPYLEVFIEAGDEQVKGLRKDMMSLVKHLREAISPKSILELAKTQQLIDKSIAEALGLPHGVKHDRDKSKKLESSVIFDYAKAKTFMDETVTIDYAAMMNSATEEDEE